MPDTYPQRRGHQEIHIKASSVWREIGVMLQGNYVVTNIAPSMQASY